MPNKSKTVHSQPKNKSTNPNQKPDPTVIDVSTSKVSQGDHSNATIVDSQLVASKISESMDPKLQGFNVGKQISRIKIPLTNTQIAAIIGGLLAIGLVAWLAFAVIPQAYDQTDDAKNLKVAKQKEDEAKQAETDKKQVKEQKDKQIADQNQVLKFESRKDWTVDMNIKVADQNKNLKINFKSDYAPKTVENFIRLSYQKYYNNVSFHRMVTGTNFSVIQGGDPQGDGKGGETAKGEPIPDELWQVKPEFDTTDPSKAALKNEPKFRAPELYTDFNTQTGEVTYRKGLIIMAKTDQPDSATSQFFITLDKTRFSYDGLRAQRLVEPMIRSNGVIEAVTWKKALRAAAEKLTSVSNYFLYIIEEGH